MGDCKDTDPTQVEWTELTADLVGQQLYDSGSGQWPVFGPANRNPWSVTAPDLSGDFLLRDEVKSSPNFNERTISDF